MEFDEYGSPKYSSKLGSIAGDWMAGSKTYEDFKSKYSKKYDESTISTAWQEGAYSRIRQSGINRDDYDSIKSRFLSKGGLSEDLIEKAYSEGGSRQDSLNYDSVKLAASQGVDAKKESWIHGVNYDSLSDEQKSELSNLKADYEDNSLLGRIKKIVTGSIKPVAGFLSKAMYAAGFALPLYGIMKDEASSKEESNKQEVEADVKDAETEDSDIEDKANRAYNDAANQIESSETAALDSDKLDLNIESDSRTSERLSEISSNIAAIKAIESESAVVSAPLALPSPEELASDNNNLNTDALFDSSKSNKKLSLDSPLAELLSDIVDTKSKATVDTIVSLDEGRNNDLTDSIKIALTHIDDNFSNLQNQLMVINEREGTSLDALKETTDLSVDLQSGMAEQIAKVDAKEDISRDFLLDEFKAMSDKDEAQRQLDDIKDARNKLAFKALGKHRKSGPGMNSMIFGTIGAGLIAVSKALSNWSTSENSAQEAEALSGLNSALDDITGVTGNVVGSEVNTGLNESLPEPRKVSTDSTARIQADKGRSEAERVAGNEETQPNASVAVINNTLPIVKEPAYQAPVIDSLQGKAGRYLG